MPNEIKRIKSKPTKLTGSNAARQQVPLNREQDSKPSKKAGDGAMTFMVWSIAGTVIAACSEPIFGGGTDLTGGGGGGDTQSGPGVGALTNGRISGADISVVAVDENGARSENPVGDSDAAGNIILDDDVTLVLDAEYIADLDVPGAREISTGEGVSGTLRSLPYSGGDLVISPLTDLLAKALDDATAQEVADAGGDDGFYQGVLDGIYGESIVTVDDVLNRYHYNPLVTDDAVTQLVSQGATALSEIQEQDSTTPNADRIMTLQELFSGYRDNIADDDATNDALVLSDSGTIDEGVEGRIATAVARGGLPVVATPNGGDAIRMTEDQDLTLVSGNAEFLFGFQDPFGNSDSPDDEDDAIEPGQLVGIYIQAASVDGNVDVMFRNDDDTIVGLALVQGADRGVVASAPAMDDTPAVRGTPIPHDSTFFYVSAEHFARLILSPADNFNTANVANPQIRFYVYDGEHVTPVAGIGELEIEVTAVDDLATAIALTGTVTTLAEDAVDSARVKVADIDITDGDGGQFGTLQLAGTNANEFEIDGDVLYLRENANIDYDAGVTSLNVRVQLSEATSTGDDLTISITDVDDSIANVDEGDASFNVASDGNIAAAVAGDVLTVSLATSDPDGDGTFTYQWQRGGTPIAGATSTTYTIAAADEGNILRVVVSYTDGGGTSETVTTSGVTVPTPSGGDNLATAIALTGPVTTLAEDAVDSVRVKVADIDITDEDGGQFGTLELAGANHTLFQIDGTELFLRQSAAIDHETTPSLVVSVRLTENTSVTSTDLTITITNVDEGTASFSVTSSGGGTPVEGDELTVAMTTSDPDGDGTFSYQWERDGTEITGETSTTYTIAADDEGTALTVVVSYTDGGNKSETVTIPGVTVPAPGMNNLATAIAFSNEVSTVAEDAVDSVRVKVADIDITDEDGDPFGTLELAGANHTLFQIDGTELFLRQNASIDHETADMLEVRVQLNEATGTGADFSIEITNVDEGTASFSVTSSGGGTPVEGDELTVAMTTSDPDGDGTFSYQWERDGAPITGETSTTYTIAADDEGTALTVVVSYTDGGNKSETVTIPGVTVPVPGMNNLATAIAFSNEVSTVAEDAVDSVRVKVADIDITDEDGDPFGTLELAGANHTLFQIDGTELFLRQNASIDHETADMLEVRVQLNEATGTGADFSIEITNVDEGTASFSVTSSGGGTPVEGDDLTVAMTTSDPDGDGTFSYQWERGDAAGSNYVAIAGETSTTYTIVAGDVGTNLRVVVSYTDDGSKSETVTTPGVSVPAAGDNPATAIALTATAVTTVDEGLSTRMKVADIDITDDDGGSPGTLELAGTNTGLFEIDLPNLDLYLKAGQSLDFETLTTLAVRVQLMGDSSVSSPDLTITVTNVDEGEARFNVASDGDDIAAAVEGDVLTVSLDASNPDPDGNGNSGFTYQWERDDAEIAGATGATYTIARDDEGTTLTVVVSYTDAGGFSEAVETSGVAVPVDNLATAIALTGTVVTFAEDAVDSARAKVADIDITDEDDGRSGTLELAGANANLFQIDGGVLYLRQNADINHETAPSLVVSVRLTEDTGVTSPDLTIAITNVDEGQASFSVTSTGGSDTPAEGHVLTVARTTSDPDGDGTFAYQWHRDGTEITGEASATYTIAADDVGTVLTVVVTYTDGGSKSETVTIPGASVPADDDDLATAIAFTGTVATVAENAVDSARVKVADIDITDGDSGLFGTLQLAGTDPDEFEIDGTVLYLKEGANINYDAPDRVTTLNVRVQLSEDTSIGANLDISITNVDEGEAGFNVASSGADINAAVEGDELTVSLDASSPDPDGNGDGTLTYQWERDGAEIAGAIGATYTIVRADEGTALTVVVSYTDEGGFNEAVETSAVTVPVDALATVIAFSNEVATLPEDEDLTVARRKVADIDITDEDGGRSGTLELAGANHTLFQIDGTELFLRQNASIDHETADMLEVRVQLNEATGTGADFSIEITNVDEGTASFSVTSSAGSDTPAEGHVLTVARTTSDLDGDGTLTYQWQRGDADGNNYVAIAGEISTTYTIIEADEGNTLRVVVSYTDGGGKGETVTTSGVSVPLPTDNPATAIALTATAVTTVDEGVSTRMKVADIDITDEDGGQFGTLELAGTNHTLFEIDLPNRDLYLKSGQSLDFETLATLNVRVQLVGTPTIGANLDISITNVDEGEARFNVASNGNLAAAVEGDELTVSLDASSPDPDGNGDGTLTYQWERDGAEITGETDASYTIVRADEGTALTVVVSYTDAGGFSEAVETSGVAVPVDDLATAIAFTGTVVSLPEGPATGSSRKVADIDITDGDGGRSGTLELAGTHANLFEFGGTDNNELHLKGTTVLDHETAEMLVVSVRLMEKTDVTSPDLTITITNVDEGQASFSVTSSAGSDTPAEGHVLTVARTTSDPDGDGTLTYEWQRGDADGNNYVAIASATSTTYTIAAADEGNTLRVVVSYTDDGNESESVTTPSVSVPVPTDNPATAIALTGTVTTVAEDLSTRTKVADIDITDEDGGQFGTLELAGTNHTLFEIDLPNRALYLKAGQSLDFETLTTLNVRVQLVGTPTIGANLDISITNVDEGDASFNVTSTGNLNAAAEGHVLTVARTTSDPDGDGTFTYQWERDGAEIAGATSATYTIVRADEGTALTVVVSYTDAGGFNEAVETSPVTVPVDALATAITLTGTVTTLPENTDLTAARRKVADITITDGDGGRSGTLELAGANHTLFEIVGTELFLKQNASIDHETAATLTVRVQLNEATGTDAGLTIDITNVDEGQAVFNVTSDGNIAAAAEGDVLTVARATSDPDGDGTLTYEWQRNGVPIAGATSTTYTIVEDDEGTTLTVVVSYTDDGGKKETVTASSVTVPAPLVVTNEAVRAFVVINGVEFRVNDDSNATPRNDYKITFDTTSQNDDSNYVPADGTIELTIDTRPANAFSQANIARLFNEADLTGLDAVAIILEEDTTTTFADADWTDEDFSTASTTLDRTVTEDDEADETARGFLEVTGGTGYTYTGNFEGMYGDLIIDGDGNWIYIIDNTDPLTQGLNGGMSGTDEFAVLITQTAGTGSGRSITETISITVNGVNEPTPAPVFSGASEPTGTVTDTDTAFDNIPADLTGRSILLATVTGDITWSVATPVVAGDTTETDAAYFGELTFPGSAFAFGTPFDRSGSGLPWQFDPTAGINDLDAGESVTITYEVTATQGDSPSSTQDLVITLEGIDDALVFDTNNNFGPVVVLDPSNNAGDAPTATGTFSATDPDDDITWSATTTSTLGSVGFSSTTNGMWTFTLNTAGITALNDLASGMTQDITFDITANTVDAGSDLTIRLTGAAMEVTGLFAVPPATADTTGTAAADSLTGTPAAETIQGGNDGDTIITGGGNDLVIGGYGGDTITLDSDAVTAPASAETIVYRFESDARSSDGFWQATDGDDTINNFRRGQDKLIFIDVSDNTPITSLEEFIMDDDLPVIRFTGFNDVGSITGFAFTFPLGGTADGTAEGSPAGFELTVNFDQAAPLPSLASSLGAAFNDASQVEDFSVLNVLFGGSDTFDAFDVVDTSMLPTELTIL